MTLPLNTIICGPALEILKTLPDVSVNCCISSPPYWALRDYGVAGQLGLEPTFEEYIDKLCTIYDEVKRVLRKDGTCFVNLGDTYSCKPVGRFSANMSIFKGRDMTGHIESGAKDKTKCGVPEKSLCLIPQRFAIEMSNRGWILRNVIVFHKPNPMPSSAKDRFTVDFEQVFFFVKSKRYFFEPQYEAMAPGSEERLISGCTNKNKMTDGPYAINTANYNKFGQKVARGEVLGRNKRCVWRLEKKEWLAWCERVYDEDGAVWRIPTQSFSEAHFATYPEKLVEPMILAGCPEFVCKKCGQPRKKIYHIETMPEWEKTHKNNEIYELGKTSALQHGGAGYYQWREEHPSYFKGYTDCGCPNPEYRPGIVLDPFLGSGTTAQVAAYLRRDWVGVELKKDYIPMAQRRIAQGETGIPVKEQAYQLALFP